MADYMSVEKQSPQVVSKRKKSSEHPWTNSDVRDLIYMWQQEECLYNTQNEDYLNSAKQSGAIERISVEIHVPAKEVTKKWLRTTQTESYLIKKVWSWS